MAKVFVTTGGDPPIAIMKYTGLLGRPSKTVAALGTPRPVAPASSTTVLKYARFTRSDVLPSRQRRRGGARLATADRSCASPASAISAVTGVSPRGTPVVST